MRGDSERGTLEQMFLSFIIIRSNGSANIYLPISGRILNYHRLPSACLAGEMFCLIMKTSESQVFLILLLISLKAFSKAKKLGKVGQFLAGV